MTNQEILHFIKSVPEDTLTGPHPESDLVNAMLKTPEMGAMLHDPVTIDNGTIQLILRIFEDRLRRRIEAAKSIQRNNWVVWEDKTYDLPL